MNTETQTLTEPSEPDLRTEAKLMDEFLHWGTRVFLGVAFTFGVLYVVFRSPSTLLFAGLMVILWLTTAFARRLVAQQRLQAALFLVSAELWLIALVQGARGGYTLAVAVLFCVWPVVLGVAYSSRQTLLRIIAIATVACGLAGILSTFDGLLPSTLPQDTLLLIAVVMSILTFGLVSLSLWHSGSRLREALAESRDKTRALEESEKHLEREVQSRTAELQGAMTEISTLNQLGLVVNSTLDVDRVLEKMNDALRSLFDFDQLAVFLLDPEGARLLLDRQVGMTFQPELSSELALRGVPLESPGSDERTSALARAVHERRHQFFPDLRDASEGLSAAEREVCEAHSIRSALLCPLEIEGSPIGTIFFANRTAPMELDDTSTHAIQRYLTTLATAVKNARLFREANEASLAKSQFLANISHELRTPLNAIIGYSEMLKEDAEDEGADSYATDLDKILSSGRHLLQLINGVLDLAKIESGRMEFYVEELDAAELVRGVEATVMPMVRSNENQIEITGLEQLGRIRCDATKLRQMLFNLLSNACKFTEKGLITLDTDRFETGSQEWLRFRVTDTGLGMTPDQLDKIFDEFQQADSSISKDFGGTGLGLPITKRFCEHLGGSITASSSLGAGSSFEIQLPAVAQIKTDAGAATP